MFLDAIDGTVTAELNDNGDGKYVIVNLTTDDGGIGIALTKADAEAMSDMLRSLAAGLD